MPYDSSRPTNAPPLTFCVLGPVEARRHGRQVDLGARQHRVLAILLTRVNQWVSIDQLVDDLWGEQPPERALGGLHVYISRIRKALEPDRPPRSHSSVVESGPSGYRLVAAPEQLDAAVFEQLLHDGRRALALRQPEQARGLLSEALSLWRGGPYDQFAYEQFAASECARLSELRMLAEESLVDADMALGRHADAVPVLEKLAAEHPLRERFHAQLMTALYAIGRQTDALRHYQRVRATLLDEVGVEPGAELQELERRILQQDVRLAPATADRPAPEAVGIVGREHELGRLTWAVDRVASAGPGVCVAIAGEPGIGKSRLLDELAQMAADRGVAFAAGRAVEDADQPAFWPWTQVLRGLVRRLGAERVLEAAGPLRQEVFLVAPELGPPLSAPTHADVARFRVSDALATLVARLAEDEPLVLAFDDVHRGDDDTLRTITLLAERLPTARVLIALAYRDELSPRHPLARLFADLSRTTPLERLPLDRLDADATARLVAQLAGGRDHVDPAAVHASTEGNPFFVVETTRLLAARPHADGIPLAIRDVVRERVHGLGDPTAGLLQAAAVIGREFDFDVAADVCGLEPARAVDAVERAMVAGVVVAGDEPGRLRFSHTLIRAALADDLVEVRRAALHADIAASLARRHCDDPTRYAELANHARASAQVAPPAAVVAQLRVAARGAMSVLAVDHARRLHDERLAAAHKLPDPSLRAREELEALVDLAVVSTWTRGYQAAEVHELVERALRLSDYVPDTPSVVGALQARWAYHTLRAEFDRADEVAHEIEALAERTRTPLASFTAAFTKGVLCWHRGQTATAAELLDAAAEFLPLLADQCTSGIIPAHPLVAHGAFASMVLALLGQVEAGTDLAARSVAAAREALDDFSHSFALMFQASTLIVAGDADAAAEAAHAAVDIAGRGGFIHTRLVATVYAGWADAVRSGDMRSLAAAERAAAELADLGAAGIRHFLLALIADAWLHLGDHSRALVLADEAVRTAKETGERFWLEQAERVRAAARRRGRAPAPAA